MSKYVIGERVRNERKRAKITQQKMADMLEISLRHYQRIEASEGALSKVPMTEELLNKFSSLLGIDSAYFTGESDSLLTYEGTDENGLPQYMKLNYVQTQFREVSERSSQLFQDLNHYCLIPDEAYAQLSEYEKGVQQTITRNFNMVYVDSLLEIKREGKSISNSDLYSLIQEIENYVTSFIHSHAIATEKKEVANNGKNNKAQ